MALYIQEIRRRLLFIGRCFLWISIALDASCQAVPYSMRLQNLEQDGLGSYFHVRCSQRGSEGPISMDRASQVCEEIQAISPLGVTINSSGLEPNLYGGTCSALAFTFAREYLEQQGAVSWSHYFRSSQKMRNLQAAFNCIQVPMDAGFDDPLLAKLQTIASWFDLQLQPCHGEIDTRHALDVAAFIEVCTQQVGMGVLRIRKPLCDVLMDVCGHTCIIVYREGCILVYDPNMGAACLAPDEFPAFLETFFEAYVRTYDVFFARLYACTVRASS